MFVSNESKLKLTPGFLSTSDQWKNQITVDNQLENTLSSDPISKFKYWLNSSTDFIRQLKISDPQQIVQDESIYSKLMIANISADFVTCSATTMQPSSRKI